MLLIQLKAYFKKECCALRYAAEGLFNFLLHERKTILYTIATLFVVVLGIYARVNHTEWILLTLATGSVWVAELFNSCIEDVLNLLHPQRHEKVKRIKDMAAGAVLFTCISSLVTGLIIFLPKLF